MAVLDQATIWTEFNTVIPEEVRKVLRPHVIGPQGELHRYTDPDEKPDINLGSYDHLLPNTFAWPNKSSGSLVDLSFVKLFIDAGLLLFFTDGEGGGSGTITMAPSYPSRIKTTAADGYKTNGSFVRDALLKDRDVRPGDVVHVKHLADELYTTVKSLIGDVIPAVIAAATTDAANPATQGIASSDVQTLGTVNDVTITSTDPTLYNGLEDGFINETYTVEVIQGSTGGDATTALFRITSASGLDNVVSIAPSAFASATPVGIKGFEATWDHTGDEFVIGQTWSLTVSQAFTKPVPTSGGTYTGTETLTYIIRVLDGGFYTDVDKPKIVVTSSLGTDQSGPTDVTAAATNVPVGTHGVLVQFSGTQLRRDDIYYISVTAPGVGAYKTIELNDNLPSGLQVAADMLLELSIQKNLEVPAERESSPPDLNWEADQLGITVNDGIDAGDDTLTDSGVPFTVPVISGPGTLVYAHYRAWSLVNDGSIVEISDPDMVEAQLGKETPDNPLAYAAKMALANANGRTVNFTGISDPDDVSKWTDALDILEGLGVYTVVVLTSNQAVHDAVKVHLDAQSQDDVGGWRVAFLPSEAEALRVVVDDTITSNTSVALGTLADNPGQAGTQYTYLTCTTGNAKFVTNGVRAGDTVRYLFSLDGFGNTVWTEFTVASVVNEDVLIFELPGHTSAVAVAQKFEVWRNPTKNEQAATIVARASAFADKRVRLVWPDLVETADGEVDGFYLCAALAGYTCGVAPHQGLEGIPMSGVLGADRSLHYFNNAQLNTLRDGGVFTVTQTTDGVIIRNGRTTDTSSLENNLEVVNRNDDAIRQVINSRIAAFFGIASLTEAGISLLRSETEQAFFVLQNQTFINRLGNMVIEHEIVDIRLGTIADELLLQATVTRPFPIQELNLELIFS